MKTWKVLIRIKNGYFVEYIVEATSPDEALTRLQLKGDYIPEAGDTVKQCFERFPNPSQK